MESLRPKNSIAQVEDIQRHAGAVDLLKDMTNGAQRHVVIQFDHWKSIGLDAGEPRMNQTIPLPAQLLVVLQVFGLTYKILLFPVG